MLIDALILVIVDEEIFVENFQGEIGGNQVRWPSLISR
jgi:hypothetical protein